MIGHTDGKLCKIVKWCNGPDKHVPPSGGPDKQVPPKSEGHACRGNQGFGPP